MKAPPRTKWPPAGSQIKLVRQDGCGAGLLKFVAICGDSLLHAGLNRDGVSFTPLAELKSIEVLAPNGRSGTVWGS